MGDDVVSTYLQRKLSSNLREAEEEVGSSLWIISRFRLLEKQISEKSSACCRIPVDVLYDVIGALSECRVFNYERPAVSKKGFFYFIRVLHHPLSEILLMRKMRERLKAIAEKLQKLSPTSTPVVAQSETTIPISDILGFEEEVAQIEKCLIPNPIRFTEIAIVGKWGCGKTTLARKVFATPAIVDKFSPVIWVSLSGKKARETIVKCIEEKIRWDDLNGKRYLIVLDDAWWSGGLELDLLPKGCGGALILTTRRNRDFGPHTNVIQLKPRLSDEICWQIFSKALQQAKLDPTTAPLSTIRNDVTRNAQGRPLAVKTLGTIIPKLIVKRKHWLRARDLRITWSDETRYWKWSNLPPPEEAEEVAVLVAVCWLDIIGSLELKMLLLNKTYSAYLVYKLKERREYLHEKMWGSVKIVGKAEEGGDVYLDSDHPVPWAEAKESGWLEMKLGEFFNADGIEVEARLFQLGAWKSGLVVKGISFVLN